MSIRKKVYLVISAVIFIPYFVYILLAVRNMASVNHASYINILDAYNEFAATEFGSFTSINKNQIASFAGSYYTKQLILQKDEKQSIGYLNALQNIQTTNEYYNSKQTEGTLLIADASGTVVFSSVASLAGMDISQFDCFKNTIGSSGRSVRSEYVQQSNGIVFSAPVVNNDNSVLGVVIKITDFNFMKDYFSEVRLCRTGFMFAIDSSEAVISADSGEKIPSMADNSAQNPFHKLFSDARADKKINEKIIKYNINGKKIFAKAKYFKEMDFLIVSAIESSEMDKVLYENIYLFIAAGVVLLLLALVISFVYSNKLLKPIRIINEAIEKNKSSEDYVYINYKSKSEFGHIASSFNEMIDKIKRIQEKIKKDEINYYKALKGVNDVVWEWSFADKQFSASDGWVKLFGANPPQIMTRKYLRENILVSEDSEKAIAVINNQLSEKSPYYRITVRVKTADGKIKWVESKGLTYFDENGVPLKLLGSITDVTEYKEVQQRLFEIIYSDMLTGIRSKFKISKDINEVIEKYPAQNHCLAIIDLDDIKDINDSYGHNIGDKIIKWVADCIEKRLGENDIAGRFGGDEFIVLFSDVADLNAPIEFIKNLRNEIKGGFQYKQTLLPISFSSGISYYPKDANNAKNLLKYSDIALLEAKNSGKDRYMVFSKSMLEHRLRQNRIKLELSKAIANKELDVYFQPIFDTKTHRLRGAEALARFTSKTMGPISPAEFIPISEKTGEIHEIGLYCLEQSCLALNKLKEMNIEIDFISVNLSINQLYYKGFIKRIKEIFEKTNTDAGKIKFEITESVFIHSYNFVLEKIMALKAMGVQIALDDFGSGYSSLAHLSEMPIDVIKIDKSFTDQIVSNYKNYNVIALIIMLAERLGIEVVAEGVETKEQLDAYYELDCDMIQGFYFAKPMPEQDFIKLAQAGSAANVVEIV